MKLFYCAFESIFDPVFESQVLVFLEKINKKLINNGEEIDLVIFGSFGDLFRKDYIHRRKYIKKFLNGRCHFAFKFPYFYKIPFLFKFSLFVNTLICFLVFGLAVRLKKGDPAVFHCRSEIGSYFILALKRKFFKNAKVICDCRGIGSREVLYKYKGRSGAALAKKIKEIENFSQKNSDYLFCVTNAFKEYIKRETDITGGIRVVPCCLDTGRFKYDPRVRAEIRRDFNIGNKFVILYAGSMSQWQLPLEMVKIFKIFSDVIKSSLFMVFTKDIKYARKLFSDFKFKEDDYILEAVPYYLMSKYLQAGDLGLLIRQDNNVNRVAFPIKFFEYIRSGVPVFSSITSDLKDMIEKHDLGFWVKNYNDEKEVKKIALMVKSKLDFLRGEGYKRRISTVIEDKMSWDSYLDSVVEIYKRV
jgi:glycosyltransferase involved in cell wall biosynthesis